jgi:hypothetical protein
MKTGECRLCLEVRPLCESHVISEFLYKRIYDSKHRIWIIDPNNPEYIGTIFKGIWEPLLCEICERKLRDWENYASRVIYGPEPLLVDNYPGLLLYRGIDYTKFKLFQLSLLWRMGIAHKNVGPKTSAANRFFRKVILGEHEERLRLMLFNNSPGDVHEYGCIMSAAHYKGRVVDDLLLEAEHHRIEGLNGYRFFIGGLVVWFTVSKGSKRFPRKEFFLQTNGSLRIDIGDLHEFGFITNSIEQMQPVTQRHIHLVTK